MIAGMDRVHPDLFAIWKGKVKQREMVQRLRAGRSNLHDNRIRGGSIE